MIATTRLAEPSRPDKAVRDNRVEGWESVVEKHFPNLMPVVESLMSVVGSMLLSDLSGCPALVLVGQPSSAKTTALNFFHGDFVYPSDAFTPKSFVSHAANVIKEELEKVDMLPRIKHKLLVVKDLAPTLGKRTDDLQEALGVLTRVLDGQGYKSDSGMRGQRGYDGDYRFGFVAASTPLSPAVWKIMSQLGPRLLFLSIDPTPESQEDAIRKLIDEDSYNDKVAACREAVSAYVGRVWEKAGGFGGVEWDRKGDDRERIEDIVKLADLGIKLRSHLSVEKGEGDEVEFTPAMSEGPDRYRNMLHNLARGHAITQGRTGLELDDIRVIARIVLSSGSEGRRRLLGAVVKSDDALTVAQTASTIDCSVPTARQTAHQLESLGLVTISKSKGKSTVTLHESLVWLRKIIDGV